MTQPADVGTSSAREKQEEGQALSDSWGDALAILLNEIADVARILNPEKLCFASSQHGQPTRDVVGGVSQQCHSIDTAKSFKYTGRHGYIPMTQAWTRLACLRIELQIPDSVMRMHARQCLLITLRLLSQLYASQLVSWVCCAIPTTQMVFTCMKLENMIINAEF